MTDTLHQIAENDTPAAVQVPRTLNGLVVWAVGRFGGGILMAAACAWALSKVYEDQKVLQDRMMQLLEQRAASDSARAKADSELASAISGMRSAVDEIVKEARGAHCGAGQ